jgi:ubiquinone/menaquinone biosynthesis C-methylase UbiE
MLALHGMNSLTRSAAIGEMKRVLKKSGRILLIDFHPGSLHPVDGWIARLVIQTIETMAGGDHYDSYRHFMANEGLPALVRKHALCVEERKLVAGGAMALYLLSL